MHVNESAQSAAAAWPVTMALAVAAGWPGAVTVLAPAHWPAAVAGRPPSSRSSQCRIALVGEPVAPSGQQSVASSRYATEPLSIWTQGTPPVNALRYSPAMIEVSGTPLGVLRM